MGPKKRTPVHSPGLGRGSRFTVKILPAGRKSLLNAKNQLAIMNRVLKKIPLMEEVAIRKSPSVRNRGSKPLLLAAPKVRALAQREIESVVFSNVSKRGDLHGFVDSLSSSPLPNRRGMIKMYFDKVATKEKISLPDAKKKIMNELMRSVDEIDHARTSTFALTRFEKIKAKKETDPHRTAHLQITADAFNHAFAASSNKIVEVMLEVGRTEPRH